MSAPDTDGAAVLYLFAEAFFPAKMSYVARVYLAEKIFQSKHITEIMEIIKEPLL